MRDNFWGMTKVCWGREQVRTLALGMARAAAGLPPVAESSYSLLLCIFELDETCGFSAKHICASLFTHQAMT
jgi:hypothetical protein